MRGGGGGGEGDIHVHAGRGMEGRREGGREGGREKWEERELERRRDVRKKDTKRWYHTGNNVLEAVFLPVHRQPSTLGRVYILIPVVCRLCFQALTNRRCVGGGEGED